MSANRRQKCFKKFRRQVFMSFLSKCVEFIQFSHFALFQSIVKNSFLFLFSNWSHKDSYSIKGSTAFAGPSWILINWKWNHRVASSTLYSHLYSFPLSNVQLISVSQILGGDGHIFFRPEGDLRPRLKPDGFFIDTMRKLCSILWKPACKAISSLLNLYSNAARKIVGMVADKNDGEEVNYCGYRSKITPSVVDLQMSNRATISM